MAGLFAVFSAAPRVFLEFWILACRARPAVAAVVVLVFGASMLAPGLSARLGFYRATLVGLDTVIGAIALLLVLVARNAFLPFVVGAAIFLSGVASRPAVSAAAALRKQSRSRGSFVRLRANGEAACGALLAAVALGLAIVLALASPLTMILHGWDGRLSVASASLGEELFAGIAYHRAQGPQDLVQR
jgi:hypothetical protein